MLTHLRRNVVAYLALFVALGGTSYAATSLPKDSVTAKQIKSGAVRSAEVKDGSLTAGDFQAGQLPVGPQGPKGEAGAVGPTYAGQGVGGTNPPTTPANASTLITTLALPRAGQVFTYGHAAVTVGCTAGTTVGVGLYLDGTPVPGTGRVIPTSGATVEMAGLTATVPAGSHQLVLGYACTSGDDTGGFIGEIGGGGILLGS